MPEKYGTGCFICHRPFGDGVDATWEDVVPRWVLRSLGLGNAGADLPNGQVRRYGNRKVPCCYDCNQRMSTSLEKPVSRAFREGWEAVQGLDPMVLFLWMAKLYYGSRFLETGLRAQVADPNAALMLEPAELVAKAEYLRRCLQHRPDQLVCAKPPASIFVFEAGVPVPVEQGFDFFVPTTPPADMVAVRCNATFVIATFGDNGVWGPRLGGLRLVDAAMRFLVLHPAQCDELMLLFATELGGHDNHGCYDFVTIPGSDEVPCSVFFPQFVVEPNEAPRPLLNRLRLDTSFHRLGLEPTPQARLDAASGRLPTTLVNVLTDELVQATCFERSCLGVLRLAGWAVDGAPCAQCGA